MSERGDENGGDGAGWLAGLVAALIGLPALVACCGGGTALVALAGGGLAAAGASMTGNILALTVSAAAVAGVAWHLRRRRAHHRLPTRDTREEQT